MAIVGEAFIRITPKADQFGPELQQELGPQLTAAGDKAGAQLAAGIERGVGNTPDRVQAALAQLPDVAGGIGDATGAELASSVARSVTSGTSNLGRDLSDGLAASVDATVVGERIAQDLSSSIGGAVLPTIAATGGQIADRLADSIDGSAIGTAVAAGIGAAIGDATGIEADLAIAGRAGGEAWSSAFVAGLAGDVAGARAAGAAYVDAAGEGASTAARNAPLVLDSFVSALGLAGPRAIGSGSKAGEQLGLSVAQGVRQAADGGLEPIEQILFTRVRGGREAGEAGRRIGAEFAGELAAGVDAPRVGPGLVDDVVSGIEDAGGRNAPRARGVGRDIAGQLLAGFATLSIANLIRESIDLAADAGEQASKAEHVFGSATTVVTNFARGSAESVGLSERAATAAAATYGNLFVALGVGERESAKLSVGLVKLSGDLASFNNADPSEVLDALRAGLVGEAEPLRRFGININQARLEQEALNLKLVEAGEPLTGAAKAQAAYSLIMQDSAKAQGDFARTSDSLANQQRILAAEFENAKVELGRELLPVMLQIVHVGRDFLEFFTSLPGPLQVAVVSLVGLSAAAKTIGPGLGIVKSGLQGVLGLLTGGGGAAGAGAGAGAAGGGIVGGLSAMSVGIGVAAAAIVASFAVYQAWATNQARVREEAEALRDTIVSGTEDATDALAKQYKEILKTRDSFAESLRQAAPVQQTDIVAAVNADPTGFDKFRAIFQELGEEPAVLRREWEGLRNSIPNSVEPIVRALLDLNAAGELSDNALREVIDGAADLSIEATLAEKAVDSMATKFLKAAGDVAGTEQAFKLLQVALNDNAPLEDRQLALQRLIELFPEVAAAAGLLSDTDSPEALRRIGDEAGAAAKELEQLVGTVQDAYQAFSSAQSAADAHADALAGVEDATRAVADAQRDANGEGERALDLARRTADAELDLRKARGELSDELAKPLATIPIGKTRADLTVDQQRQLDAQTERRSNLVERVGDAEQRVADARRAQAKEREDAKEREREAEDRLADSKQRVVDTALQQVLAEAQLAVYLQANPGAIDLVKGAYDRLLADGLISQDQYNSALFRLGVLKSQAETTATGIAGAFKGPNAPKVDLDTTPAEEKLRRLEELAAAAGLKIADLIGGGGGGATTPTDTSGKGRVKAYQQAVADDFSKRELTDTIKSVKDELTLVTTARALAERGGPGSTPTTPGQLQELKDREAGLKQWLSILEAELRGRVSKTLGRSSGGQVLPGIPYTVNEAGLEPIIFGTQGQVFAAASNLSRLLTDGSPAAAMGLAPQVNVSAQPLVGEFKVDASDRVTAADIMDEARLSLQELQYAMGARR